MLATGRIFQSFLKTPQQMPACKRIQKPDSSRGRAKALGEMRATRGFNGRGSCRACQQGPLDLKSRAGGCQNWLSNLISNLRLRRNPLISLVSPTGFEPVLPT